MKQKLIKFIIAGGIVVVVLVAALITASSISKDKNSNVKVFIKQKPENVQHLTVTNQYGTFEVKRNGDGYDFDDMPANIIDQEGFYDLMYNVASFGALRTVEENAQDISLYGLDNPLSAVDVIYSGGKEFKLIVGNKEQVSGNYYGMVNDDKNVYLFAEEDILYFLVPKQTFINLQVTPTVQSGALSAMRDVTFSGYSLEKPITIEAVKETNVESMLAALSFGSATHLVKIKGTYELDQTYGGEVLESILGIEATSVVAYNVTDADLSMIGFDNPYMQVDFSIQDGTDYIADYQLKLVPYENRFLAYMKDSGILFLIDPPAFANIDYTKLCRRWFLNPMRSDVESITVEFDGIKYVYATGGDQKNIWAKLNGKEMDTEIFFAFYRLLKSAAADGKYLESTVNEGSPLMTITYKYNEKLKTDDVMKLYPGSLRRVNVEINGITEFDMRETFVDAMKNACKNSLLGQPIDENW